MYFIVYVHFVGIFKIQFTKKARNLKLQDNVTYCKRTGALNVGLKKTYNGPSSSILYVGICCLEDKTVGL